MNYLIIAIALISIVIVFFITKNLIRFLKEKKEESHTPLFTKAPFSELPPMKEKNEYINNIGNAIDSDNYFIGYSTSPLEEVEEDELYQEDIEESEENELFTEFSNIDIEYFGAVEDLEVRSYSLIEGHKAVLTGFDEDTLEYIFHFTNGSRYGEEVRLVNISDLDVIPEELLFEE